MSVSSLILLNLLTDLNSHHSGAVVASSIVSSNAAQASSVASSISAGASSASSSLAAPAPTSTTGGAASALVRGNALVAVVVGAAGLAALL